MYDNNSNVLPGGMVLTLSCIYKAFPGDYELALML